MRESYIVHFAGVAHRLYLATPYIKRDAKGRALQDSSWAPRITSYVAKPHEQSETPLYAKYPTPQRPDAISKARLTLVEVV